MPILLTPAFSSNRPESLKMVSDMLLFIFTKRSAQIERILKPTLPQAVAATPHFSIFNLQWPNCHLHMAKPALFACFCTLFSRRSSQTPHGEIPIAACGVGKHRVRRWQTSRAALGIAPCGVGKSGVSGLVFLPFAMCAIIDRMQGQTQFL